MALSSASPETTCTFTPVNWKVGLPPIPEAMNLIRQDALQLFEFGPGNAAFPLLAFIAGRTGVAGAASRTARAGRSGGSHRAFFAFRPCWTDRSGCPIVPPAPVGPVTPVAPLGPEAPVAPVLPSLPAGPSLLNVTALYLATELFMHSPLLFGVNTT